MNHVFDSVYHIHILHQQIHFYIMFYVVVVFNDRLHRILVGAPNKSYGNNQTGALYICAVNLLIRQTSATSSTCYSIKSESNVKTDTSTPGT